MPVVTAVQWDCEIVANSPWYNSFVKLVRSVLGTEEFLADDSEDVDDNDQDKSQVTEGTQCPHDDRQKDTHRRPRLGKLEDAQQSQLKVRCSNEIDICMKAMHGLSNSEAASRM